ncbi:sigma-54 interaction domain-containing protein [Thiohalorhabdus sp. Cl-TMA]|uniref:Sigma-54 interaction domain-containing protein n=1 Tax=Thiohalorhabdus methylotrophus TaxID=3242694 RepID=A0ABV4TSW1_9GAMM
MRNAFERTLPGAAPSFQAALRTAAVAAATDVSVLVLGETGTGKELLARALHAESPRSRGPFVSVNCATLPDGLAEAQLFGHRKGAFTGAVDHRPGLAASAAGGTLFLDEVGELSAAVQAKLLRFLEAGEYQPVGATAPERADARVVAATNRDLPGEVRAGRFREDLYYRLHVVPVELPPLRERQGDLPLLLERLTADLAARHGVAAPTFNRAARALLEAHPWPGNVRELRNLCERLVILLPGREIGPANLPADLQRAGAAGEGPFTLPEGGLRLDALEADLIRQALAKTAGNRSRAARLLGLTRDTLLYRLKKYAIQG